MPTINHRTQGFTLIELLIVISVISLLSTIVLYRTSEAKYKAEDAKMRVEVREVEKAIVMYKYDNDGQVPVGSDYTNDKLGEMVQEDSEAFQQSMQILVDRGYLSQIPQSSSGQSFVYLATPDKRNAVFAVSLNNNYSNNTSNSCSVVVGGGGDVEWGSCVTSISNPDFGCGSGDCDSCSDVNYQTNQYVCFELNTISSVCVVEYDGNYYSNDPAFPDALCALTVYENEPHETGEITFLKNIMYPPYLCEYSGDNTTSVCSGSDTSDFCACI